MARGIKKEGTKQVLSRGWTDEEKALMDAEIARRNAAPDAKRRTTESDIVHDTLVPLLRKWQRQAMKLMRA